MDRLLIVGSFPPPESNIKGGIATSCHLLCKSSLGLRFELIKLDSTQKSLPIPPIWVRTFFALVRFFHLLKSIIFLRPKVVLIFCASGLSALEKGVLLWVCSILGAPSIIFPRAGKLEEQVQSNVLFGAAIKFLFSKADLFLCQGPGWKKFASEFIGVQKSSLAEVNNWTATEELLALGRSRQKKCTSKTINILFVGWIEKEKGVWDLLQAAKLLFEQGFQFRLTLVGEGSELKRVRQFGFKFLPGRLVLKSWQNEHQLKPLWAKNEIFVLPSWTEGMPNALIEAMATKLCPVVTNVGLIPDFLTDQVDSIIVEKKNHVKLANALGHLINDEKMLNKLANEAFTTAERNFGTKTQIQKLQIAIENLI